MILLEENLNGRLFKLAQYSIIEAPVEAIVNPANESLAHGGGVAGLIARSGGPEIQWESNTKAPVPTGQATFTSAGVLPFTYVIHTVGPVWNGGTQREPQLLNAAVTSALLQAEALKVESLSMPSISTGIFGYPLEPAIQIIVTAIREFLPTAQYTREVHLCEFSQDKALEMKHIIENMS